MVERDLEKEFKEDDHPFRLAIVCAMWITGFDAPCVSTVYLDKPIKGHTLMQTIARANRVYNDEKENGLIVDYGNVYKQLEKAYSVYGEGSKAGGPKGSNGEEKENKPLELLEEDVKFLDKAIFETKTYLAELQFNLEDLTAPALKPMEKLALIKKAVDCVCLNESSRTKFEIMARDVFRKYMTLYPEEAIKQFLKDFNAIEAIYQQLNQQTKDADVIDIIKRLQQVVDENVTVQENMVNEGEEVYVDLAKLDFEKLRTLFAKTEKKNTVVFDLQRAIDKKLNKMLANNPLRMEFYERYKEIIEEYNKGKDLEDTMRSFKKLFDFVQDLTIEDTRALRENLDEESLAIFDLLKNGKTLNQTELKEVKKVAVDTLSKLKEEKLKIDRWRESRQITAQVKTMIFDAFQWLPQTAYTDYDVSEKTMTVYQHIYSSYGRARVVV
jgi:type I restriction enzyme R subunit